MAFPLGVDQPSAQHHVAAALAVDRAAPRRRGPQSREEAGVAGEAPGLQLRIAAGEVDGLGGRVRRLVGQRREEAQLGAGRAPGLQQRRIGEGEGRVPGNRDALAEGRQGRPGRAGGVDAGRPSESGQGLEVEVLGDRRRGRLQEGLQVGMLGGLDQTEVALGQDQAVAAAQAAQDRDRQAGAGGAQQLGVAGPADPVEDQAGDGGGSPGGRAVGEEALDQGGGRSAHAAGLDHQDHRPAGRGRQGGGRAQALRPGPVEEAHDPLAQNQLDLRRGPRQGRGQGRRPHRPGIQVEAGPPGGRPVEGRVDVVGADLDRADRQSGLAEVPQQRQGDQGLAAAGGRRRDQQAAGHGSAIQGLSMPMGPCEPPPSPFDRARSAARTRV